MSSGKGSGDEADDDHYLEMDGEDAAGGRVEVDSGNHGFSAFEYGTAFGGALASLMESAKRVADQRAEHDPVYGIVMVKAMELALARNASKGDSVCVMRD